MVELFAGVGGFRAALEPLGWQTVWANQWEPSTKTQHAADCYRRHWNDGSLSNEDIHSVVDRLERELTAAGVDHEPIDRDDHYSKFEATPPHWMWIEH